MNLHEFNALPAEAARAAVRPCVAIDGWVTAVVAGRPYPDAEVAVAVGDAQAGTWSQVDVEAALADHPRIGERPDPGRESSELSRHEQAGVDPADTEVARRLADGNRRYEERFGRIYLVRAAGRDAAEMLALLEERLGHDPDTELAVTAVQLAEIAALRLRGLLT